MIDPIRWGDSTLHFGDAIDCSCTWTGLDQLDDCAAGLRVVGHRVGRAQESFAFMARLPEPDGAALTAMHARGVALEEELAGTRGDLDGVAEAIRSYATALRTYRDGMAQLLQDGTRHGLEVRQQRILAPVERAPATPAEVAEGLEMWRAYTSCFERARQLRDDRTHAARRLRAELREHADVTTGASRPRRQEGGGSTADFGQGAVRRLRREAAQAAQAVVEARRALDEARREGSPGQVEEAEVRLRQAQARADALADEFAVARNRLRAGRASEPD